MGILNENAVQGINNWKDTSGLQTEVATSLTTAAAALISAANTSEYLASQLNAFFAQGGILRVGAPGDGTNASQKDGVITITIDSQMVHDSSVNA